MASFHQLWILREKLKVDVEDSPRLVMVGSVDVDHVVLLDKNKKLLYLRNISETGKPMSVIMLMNESHSSIESFDCLRDGQLVCGTEDCEILIYDENWSMTMSISTMQRKDGTLLVTVDLDGMVLAAYEGESLVNVFSPSSGTLVRSFTAGNTLPLPIHQMRALPSGRLVVLSRQDRGDWIYILEGTNGSVQHQHFSHLRYFCNITVDTSGDFFFALYRELPGGNYSVDVLSPDGKVVQRRVVEFQSMALVNAFVVLGPGQIVIQDDKILRVYKLEY